MDVRSLNLRTVTEANVHPISVGLVFQVFTPKA
jgi:hypothetical protein